MSKMSRLTKKRGAGKNSNGHEARLYQPGSSSFPLIVKLVHLRHYACIGAVLAEDSLRRIILLLTLVPSIVSFSQWWRASHRQLLDCCSWILALNVPHCSPGSKAFQGFAVACDGRSLAIVWSSVVMVCCFCLVVTLRPNDRDEVDSLIWYRR